MSFTRTVFKVLSTLILSMGLNAAQAQLTVVPHDTTVCGQNVTINAILNSPTGTQQFLSDDAYTGVLNIGFTFNYYGVPYTQLCMGANAVLNFNLTNANGYCTWPIGAAIPGNANMVNAIMGPWMDINPGTGGGINYATTGVAPNRKFIATWCGVPYYACSNILLTTQIILYETTDIIEVHLGERQTGCSWNGDYAIEGVQNNAATLATVVPGRNYPTIWSASQSAHRFEYIAGAYVVSPIPYLPIPINNSGNIIWFQGPPTNGIQVGTGSQLTVAPTVPTTYYAITTQCADTIYDTCHVTIGTGDSIDYTMQAEPSFCGYLDGNITLHGLMPNDTFIINYALNGNPQPPFQAIIPLDSSVNIPSLGAGTYIIYAVNNGCATPPVTVVLTDPPFDLDSVTVANPTICGANDGYIKFWGADVANTPYIVNYDKDGVPQPPANLTSDASKHVTLPNLGPGTYTNIVFANQFGCQTSAYGPYTFVEPPFSVDFDTATRFGCTFDTVDFFDNSIGVTQWAWDFGDGQSSNLTNPSHPYQQGVYTATLVGTNGFCTDTKSVQISLVHPLDAIFTVSKDSICNGETIIFTNQSIGTNYIYEWDFGDGTRDTAFNTSHTYTTDGIYNATLTLVDFVPCTNVESQPIVVASIDVAIGPKDTSVCLSDSMMLYSETFAPPYFSDGIQYTWTPGDNIGSTNTPQTNFYSEVSGTYSYILTATGYPMGCTASDTLSFFVQPRPVLINVTPDQVIKYGDNVQLNAEGVTYYLWTPTMTLDNPNISSPMAAPREPVTYTVVGMNEHGGCRDTAYVTIGIDFTMDEFIPSVFSPNGDGKNDVFRMVNMKYQKLVEFRVFNRWGKEVYNNVDPAKGWDGRYNGAPQDPGVYTYLIRVNTPDGGLQSYKGDVTLVR